MLLGLALVWTTLASALASADEGTFADIDRAGAAPTVSAPLSVTIAYGAIWVVLVAYLVSLWRRQGRMAADIDELRRRIDTTESG